MAEVVRADAGARQLEPGVSPSGRQRGGGIDRRRRPVPVRPAARGRGAHLGVRIFQEPVVRLDEIAVALGRGHTGAEPRPRLGEEAGDAAPVEPVDLVPPAHRHRGEDHAGDAVADDVARTRGRASIPSCCRRPPTRRCRVLGGAVRDRRADGRSCSSRDRPPDRSRAGCCARIPAGRTARCGTRRDRRTGAAPACTPTRVRRAAPRRAALPGCRSPPSTRGSRRPSPGGRTRTVRSPGTRRPRAPTLTGAAGRRHDCHVRAPRRLTLPLREAGR